MKILHLINSLGLGGAQTVVKGIFESQKDNKDLFLFVMRRKKNEIKINHSNVFIYPSESVYSLEPLKELRQFIKRNSIDILHCHLPRQQLFGYLLKKDFPSLKVIFHEHGNIFDSDLLVPFLLNHIQSRANAFIAVSGAIKEGLIKKSRINPKKIIVLYNFVDTTIFNRKNIKWNIQKEREKLKINKGDFVIGYAGRLVYRKGWKEYIESANLIIKNHPNFKFLIAGDGVDKEKMLKLINRYNLEANVIYLGYRPDMVWYYSLLDCFVLPSYWEGLPMVQLEAMAMQIPLISCDGPGMNEVAINKENSLLCPPKDYIKLSQKMIELFKNKLLRRKIIINGLKTSKIYSLNNFNKKLDEIYRAILKNDKKSI
jgi:glycosyltransferase involved in cell wall biosynthesis